MPSIVSIAIKPAGIESRPADRFARVAVECATLVEGRGIAGDCKGKGDRHLNVMCRDTLDQMQREGCRVGPGEMGEQIVLDGIIVEQLPTGARLQLGDEAIIEVVQQRTPCSRFEQIQRTSIKKAWGRVGVMAPVNRGGAVQVGDDVRVLE